MALNVTTVDVAVVAAATDASLSLFDLDSATNLKVFAFVFAAIEHSTSVDSAHNSLAGLHSSVVAAVLAQPLDDVRLRSSDFDVEYEVDAQHYESFLLVNFLRCQDN